ncbi:PREDICTED: uncharacterized protein LOC105570853 [Vollenhovia emeryi]|uniref:uncharacterized protein LOC105570853 n=1 Tax=Vollenhovia emeryi TaxID=411798 RepID=UPI0005F3C4C2|nr:PREDICTED: uncharacterized protein LOC105570853 [Vollenhovia emeryi]
MSLCYVGRQCAGCNDHSNCPAFLQLYKLLSVYSVIKPPKYGNCTVSSDAKPITLISINEIKAIYGNKRERQSAEYQRKIKEKLDQVLQYDWEADDVFDLHSEHNYTLSPILDCVIYYVTGYLCKQILTKYNSCAACEEAVRTTNCESSVSQLVDMKSRGGLIHANLRFFHLICYIEASFAKYSSDVDVFNLTLDEVLDSYTFTYPCKEHPK